MATLKDFFLDTHYNGLAEYCHTSWEKMAPVTSVKPYLWNRTGSGAVHIYYFYGMQLYVDKMYCSFTG